MKTLNWFWMTCFPIAMCCGCSFFMVPSPPSDPSERTQDAAEECKTDALIPVGDALMAAVGALNLGIAASASSGEQVRWYATDLDRGTGMALGASQLALFGAAATYGFVQISRCNALRREVRSETRGRKTEPPAAAESDE